MVEKTRPARGQRPTVVKKLSRLTKSPILRKRPHKKISSKPKLTQKKLEDAILRRCAAGKDQLDKEMAPNVKVILVPPCATDVTDFPVEWKRNEGARPTKRGTAEWYVPRGADPTRRMLFLHGGSYTVWAPRDKPYRALCSRLAAACKMCVLSVDYRMAPEHLFPAAFNDSMAALRWIVHHGPYSPTSTSDAKDIFVCGDSAGGGLAVAVCAHASPSLRPQLKGVIGISAWMDMTASTPSYETRAWDPVRCFGDAVNFGTDRQSGQEEAEVYLGRGGVKKFGRDSRVSPFFASDTRLKNMPPTLLQVGDFELILDESTLLGQKMKNIGHRDVTVRVYPRMWHCWHEYLEGSGVGQELRAAKRAIQEIGKWVRVRKS